MTYTNYMFLWLNVQNTMHRLAQNKGAYLGGMGTVGSGYPKINKGYPSDTLKGIVIKCITERYL